MGKKRKKIFQKLKNRYRLIIYNDSTIQTVWSFKLTRLKVLSIIGLIFILLILFTTVIIAYTPLREYIPGYPNAQIRQSIIGNYILVDSLESEIRIRDSYLTKIKALMEGEIPTDHEPTIDSFASVDSIDFKEFNHDSIFRQQLLEEELNLSIPKSNKTQSLSNLHFFTPLQGVVTNKFKAGEEHYAVDVVSSPNSRISSILDGTVVFAGWTLNTGYAIYIQHENNLISAYKHNAELLKNAGDKVKAGEAIAIMGNSGELTTGPHLHFELWYNGVPLNPELYIDF